MAIESLQSSPAPVKMVTRSGGIHPCKTYVPCIGGLELHVGLRPSGNW